MTSRGLHGRLGVRRLDAAVSCRGSTRHEHARAITFVGVFMCLVAACSPSSSKATATRPAQPTDAGLGGHSTEGKEAAAPTYPSEVLADPFEAAIFLAKRNPRREFLHPFLFLEMAEAHERKGAKDAAMKMLSRALDEARKIERTSLVHGRAYYFAMIADGYLRSGERKKALEVLDSAPREDGGPSPHRPPSASTSRNRNVYCQLDLGLRYAKAGDLGKAADSLNLAKQEAGKDLLTVIENGATKTGAKTASPRQEIEEANAHQLRADFAGAQAGIASEYAKAGRLADALELLSAAEKMCRSVRPERLLGDDPCNDVAVGYSLVGDTAKAQKILAEASRKASETEGHEQGG
ncbi:MAG: hypothetical protein HY897_22990 [Deltaproteobacteria bacterium]|nr:hypothetical protein [Deltaproteobacteria bacterium]